MRVRCLLRDIRGPRTMTEVAKVAGINLGALSRIEQGVAFPKDEQIPALEAAYGAMVTDWYPPIVLLAVEMEDSKREELRERMHTQLIGGLEPQHTYRVTLE